MDSTVVHSGVSCPTPHVGSFSGVTFVNLLTSLCLGFLICEMEVKWCLSHRAASRFKQSPIRCLDALLHRRGLTLLHTVLSPAPA